MRQAVKIFGVNNMFYHLQMWDIDTGDCVKVLTEHAASARVGYMPPTLKK